VISTFDPQQEVVAHVSQVDAGKPLAACDVVIHPLLVHALDQALHLEFGMLGQESMKLVQAAALERDQSPLAQADPGILHELKYDAVQIGMLRVHQVHVQVAPQQVLLFQRGIHKSLELA